MKNYSKLPRIELIAYFLLFTTAVLYAIYELYKACQQHVMLYNYDNIFEDGWSALNRKIDRTDYEWEKWTKLIFYLFRWYCLHLIGAEVFHYSSKHVILIWYTAITTFFMYYFLSFNTVILTFTQVVSYYLLAHFNRRFIVWIFFSLSTIYQNDIISFLIPQGSDDQINVIFVMSSWLHLKCISFTSHVISSKRDFNILYIFGYCFYLPCFMLGPIMLYEEFIHSVAKARVSFKQRFPKAAFNFLRFSFWYYFTEFGLHFIYIGVLPHQLQLFKLNSWAMCGLGFSMGIFFYLKYLVVYGIAGSIVQFEGYDAPPTPRCIACIHLYSDMWRYFDCGLHKFIKDCIYLPLADLFKSCVSKLFVSFICFSFIFLWHGLHSYVLIWSSLNFLGLVFELISKNFSRRPTYRFYENKILSYSNQRRFHALVAAPLTIMSAISSFYFFGEGVEVGTAFVLFLFQSSFSLKFFLIFYMYTLGQISIEYSIWSKRKTLNVE